MAGVPPRCASILLGLWGTVLSHPIPPPTYTPLVVAQWFLISGATLTFLVFEEIYRPSPCPAPDRP